MSLGRVFKASAIATLARELVRALIRALRA